MCGIIGYTGKLAAAPVLIEGLKRLEYRGYDSAGLAVVADEHMYQVKSVGKVAQLEAVGTEKTGRLRHRPYPLGDPRRAVHAECASASR